MSQRRIQIVGGGPAGLYLAILLAKADHSVSVVERNAPDATFGFGVVFSDETLGYLRDNDEPTFREVASRFARWDAIEIRRGNNRVVSPGHWFSGIARARLLIILQRRAEALGVELEFGIEVGPSDVQRWMAEH